MKINKKNSNISININKEDDDNDFLYCWDIFEDRPNKIKIYNNYLKSEFNDIISKYCQQKSFSSEVIPAEDIDIINNKYFIKVNETLYLSYMIIDSESDDAMIHEISFYFKSYEDDSKLVDEITNELNTCVIDFDEVDDTIQKLNTIYVAQTGLEVEPINKLEIDDNIDYYYNEETLKSINKLCKNIKKSDKGLSILYGERGTGKTSVINYITEKIDRMVIYIPNSLLESTINNSDFRNFLKKYHRPIIVIDDCEMIFNELFTKSNIYVNNLLQMVEGILSDMIQLNIITIFNVDDEEEIDHHLLDSNSLIDVIEFKYLDKKEANDLSNHLNHKNKYKNKTKLINIIKKTNTKEYKKIGLS